MRPGVILFFVLLFAAVFSAIKQLRDIRQERTDRLMLRRVDAFLTAWAEYGEQAPPLRAALQGILKEYPTQ